jgi:hypothetical protein
MSTDSNSRVATLPTIPNAFLPWYAVPLIGDSITVTSVVLALTTVGSFVAMLNTVGALFLVAWAVCTASIFFWATGRLTIGACKRAYVLAEVADELNVLVRFLLDEKGHLGSFGETEQKALKAEVERVSANTSSQLDQFVIVIDSAFEHGSDAAVDAILANIRTRLNNLPKDIEILKFLMGRLKKSHFRVARSRALLPVLIALTDACAKIPQKEAKSLFEEVLNLAFNPIKATGADAQERSAAQLLVPNATSVQLRGMREIFEIRDFDGVDTQGKLDGFVRFLRGGEVTWEQFTACYNRSMRESALYRITHAADFGAAFDEVHKPEVATLKKDLGKGTLAKWAYRTELMATKVASFGAMSRADVLAYFTTGKQGKALARNVLRFCDGEPVEQLREALGKAFAEGAVALKATFTPDVIAKMPSAQRSALARRIGYSEEEIHRIEGSCLANEKAKRDEIKTSIRVSEARSLEERRKKKKATPSFSLRW